MRWSLPSCVFRAGGVADDIALTGSHAASIDGKGGINSKRPAGGILAVEACHPKCVSYIGHMVQAITPHQAQQLINRGEVEIIDVREPHEWSAGHLAGARLIPLAEFRANPKANLQRDGVVFVCAAGVRSETAARIAVSLGLSRVYNLSQGTRGWVRAGLALVNDLSVAV